MRALSCVALWWSLQAAAQAPPAPPMAPASVQRDAWLESAEAAVFRRRVVDLAMLYDEGGGIDPEGYKVQARRTTALVDGCARVAVVTSRAGEAVRSDEVTACKQRH
jgi:hypothetical protein